MITDQLRKEHQIILEALDILSHFRTQLVQAPMNLDFDKVRTLLNILKDLVEEIHHAKEERILFPALANTNQLSKGGPRCTHFMNWSLMDDISSRFLKDKASLVLPMSPLRIPLEEHRAGSAGLTLIEADLSAFEADPTRTLPLLSSMGDYERLLRRHIEKEDTCLFVMAESILTTEELNNLQQLTSTAHLEADHDPFQRRAMDLEKLKQNLAV